MGKCRHPTCRFCPWPLKATAVGFFNTGKQPINAGEECKDPTGSFRTRPMKPPPNSCACEQSPPLVGMFFRDSTLYISPHPSQQFHNEDPTCSFCTRPMNPELYGQRKVLGGQCCKEGMGVVWWWWRGCGVRWGAWYPSLRAQGVHWRAHAAGRWSGPRIPQAQPAVTGQPFLKWQKQGWGWGGCKWVVGVHVVVLACKQARLWPPLVLAHAALPDMLTHPPTHQHGVELVGSVREVLHRLPKCHELSMHGMVYHCISCH